MKKKIVLAFLLLGIVSCVPVGGDRMVRVVESGASTSYLPLVSGDVGGIRVETTEKPLQGHLVIMYEGEKSKVRYESGKPKN